MNTTFVYTLEIINFYFKSVISRIQKNFFFTIIKYDFRTKKIRYEKN